MNPHEKRMMLVTYALAEGTDGAPVSGRDVVEVMRLWNGRCCSEARSTVEEILQDIEAFGVIRGLHFHDGKPCFTLARNRLS